MANSQVTPPHIVPEWYFLPFYAILRAIDFNFICSSTQQAGRRHRLRRLDRDPVLRAVARHQQGPLGHLPADVQVVLLAVRAQLHRAGLSRFGMPAEGIYGVSPRSARPIYFIYFLVVLPSIAKSAPPAIR
jgi:ubiquinol-cytochrome c reductase cytochrome b subunit